MTSNSASANYLNQCNKSSQRLFTAINELPSTQTREQASKLMDCSRYLNHTGVILGDHRRVAASHHLNTMIFALLDELEAGSSPTP
ncbi:DUF3077 domain-containing protein [Pseudomonas putida]|uniref:DUF3077 domain-containing protein n=1 Tax=Pseudomonas putida TaxID=303 RepID=UPI003A0FEC6B